jgi:nitrite reductase/ring-hydroxylating ferredoxin subunit
VNLWWSIDGVNEDNTVILYPELFGQELPFDPKNMYIAPGVQLTKPRKITPLPGELLVFNPETLHGTQVNISDSTRIVVSTRLNPETPRFDVNAPFHFEHWYSSKDLERKRFSKLSVFSKKQYPGRPRVVELKETIKETPRPASVPKALSHDEPIPICDSSALIFGDRMAVDLGNTKLMLYRDADGVHAFSRICPHLGMDLADGCQEGDQAFCPGHGIQFSLQDGSSRCEAFRLRQYRVTEKDGKIYVQLHSPTRLAQ